MSRSRKNTIRNIKKKQNKILMRKMRKTKRKNEDVEKGEEEKLEEDKDECLVFVVAPIAASVLLAVSKHILLPCLDSFKHKQMGSLLSGLGLLSKVLLT